MTVSSCRASYEKPLLSRHCVLLRALARAPLCASPDRPFALRLNTLFRFVFLCRCAPTTSSVRKKRPAHEAPALKAQQLESAMTVDAERHRRGTRLVGTDVRRGGLVIEVRDACTCPVSRRARREPVHV